METIRVNMTPCEDIKTIHASQNDNEAREWGFELHNNGDKIDSSSISDQSVFKAYEGGTEQILPENGSTPTTSPFIGDIKYPQGLLSDQEFLYRESPTEEDGNAKITDIKGNTLVWNQLVQNGNFASTDDWSKVNATFSVSNNMATFTASAQYGRIAEVSDISLVLGHKYLHKVDVKTSARTTYMQLQVRKRSETASENVITTGYTTDWQTLSSIFTASETGNVYMRAIDTATSDFVTANLKNWMLIDLTQMGLDSLTDAEILQWFADFYPLPYYQYDSGSLLPFRGEGLKTVGKNQIKLSADTLVSSQRIGINYLDNGAVFTANGTYSRAGYTCKTIKGQQYTLSFKGFSDANYGAVYISNDLDWNTKYGRINLGSTETNQSLTFTADSELLFVGFYLTNTGTSGSMTIKDIQLELGSSVTSYESYTSSTLSLPISTYFPSGMKSAGNVYDELTETKAITRVGSVDLGTLNWAMNVTSLFSAQLVGLTTAQKEKVKSALYQLGVTNFSWSLVDSYADKSISTSVNDYIYIKDTSYTDASAFKTAMNGIPLFFELSTYQETSFTTASLVTENAEIPLSNEDGALIGKCTEQLSAEPGFHDAKIKLSDEDGECYSNKIQLHIERSPQ